MISDITDPIERFVAFVVEREAIRVVKEKGMKPPYTLEPILQQYRFTNVQREHDKVSKHYQRTVRERYDEHPLVYPATVFYRWFNRPETCDAFFTNPVVNRSVFEDYMDKRNIEILLNRLRRLPTPHVTGAYIIQGMQGHPKGEGVIRYFHEWCKKPFTKQWIDWLAEPPTLQELFNWTQKEGIGLGRFMTAQIVADLKYLEIFRSAKDWWTFAEPGPGSLRGLNLVLNRHIDATWPGNDWHEQLALLNDTVTDKLIDKGLWRLHNQDLQNCLCEFSKFEKTRLGIGRPRQRYYYAE